MILKKLSLILCFLLLASCAGLRKKEPAQAPANIKQQLGKIEIDINAKAYKKALGALNKIVEKYAETDVADDAHIMMGDVYCQLSDYTNCYRSYIAVLDSDFYSPREVDANIGAATALFKLGRFDEALSLSGRALKTKDLTKSTRNRIYDLRYQILLQTGDRLETLRSLVFLSENADNDSDKSKYRIRAAEVVESNLNENELLTVAQSSDFGSYRVIALYRVGTALFEQRDYSRADDYLSKIKSIDPGSDLALQADSIIQQIEARRRVNPLVVGAVLPLTGRYAAVGYKTLRGLELGLGVSGSSNSSFKLAVIDSAGNPDTARRAVERLVVEDSAIAIIGDVTSRTADAVAQKADELGVPNIGLSQKSGLTSTGPYVFRNALTSESLVKELVRTAFEEHGMRRFAILYPNDAYGIEYANLFWDEVLARGGEIRAAQTYASKDADLRGPIQRLVGTFYLEDRLDEYNFLMKQWYSKQKTITARVHAPDDILEPIIDFDAIFIPDSVASLGQVASMLLFNDVDSVKLLGTNLWNSSEVVSRGTRLIENSLFVDATSSLNGGLKDSDFYKKFKAVYNEEPSIFEAQAYDTALAVRQMVASGARSRSALKDSLDKMRSFQGAVGQISINEKREFSRPLATLTVQGGQIAVAKPTPESKKD